VPAQKPGVQAQPDPVEEEGKWDDCSDEELTEGDETVAKDPGADEENETERHDARHHVADHRQLPSLTTE